MGIRQGIKEHAVGKIRGVRVPRTGGRLLFRGLLSSEVPLMLRQILLLRVMTDKAARRLMQQECANQPAVSFHVPTLTFLEEA